MDLDRDGRLDVITGSWPGELYVFSGLEDGSYAKATRLLDADGDPIHLGKASVVFASDWDADGDLDLVVGDVDGHVWFMPNGSGGDALVFEDALKLAVGDVPIRVEHGDAGPCLADWDGNGTLDLIVGCGDGSVWLHPNQSAVGAPVLSAGIMLLAKAPGMGLAPGESMRPGARAKPHVVDWDGDGRLDLLVGDVISVRGPTPELTAEDLEEQEHLQQKLSWVQQRLAPLSKRVMERVYEHFGISLDETSMRDAYQQLDEEQRKRYGAVYQAEIKKDVEVGSLQRMQRETSLDMRRFRPKSAIHGHVWVLLRQDS